MLWKILMFVTLVCACAAGAVDHAPPPISVVENHPKPHPKKGASGTEQAKLDAKNSDEERDDSSLDEPETVLSVRYDRGMVKELYLSQLGRGVTNPFWRPSVSERKRICLDLCEAGLGGTPCGYSCQAATPDILESLNRTEASAHSLHGTRSRISVRTVKRNDKDSSESKEETSPDSGNTETNIGYPRSEVCPVLCLNGLGNPLCSCSTENIHTRWSSICSIFCSSNPAYQIPGCPACHSQDAEVVLGGPQMLSEPSDFWLAWCKVQCKNGQGGAACNCDLAPMFLKS